MRREAWTCYPWAFQHQALQRDKEGEAATLLQCAPAQRCTNTPALPEPAGAPAWHSVAPHRHVPASQFQLWLQHPSWGCFSGFLELHIWGTSSKHNLRRDPLFSRTEATCTSGEFGPYFIWSTITLIMKKPKTHEERHLDGGKRWT